MDQPTHRLDERPPLPNAARPCLRCRTPLVAGYLSTRGSGGAGLHLYTLRVIRFIRSSFWSGNQYAATTCIAWVCPACGYTELVATDPAAMLQS